MPKKDKENRPELDNFKTDQRKMDRELKIYKCCSTAEIIAVVTVLADAGPFSDQAHMKEIFRQAADKGRQAAPLKQDNRILSEDVRAFYEITRNSYKEYGGFMLALTEKIPANLLDKLAENFGN